MRQKLSMLSFPLLLIYCYLVNSAEIAFNVGAGAPPLVKTRRSGHWELLSLTTGDHLGSLLWVHFLVSLNEFS